MLNQLNSIKLLVVDDERLMTKLIGDVLSALGFSSITIAHDGQEAKGLFCEHPFDMVISDCRMKESSGLELLRFIRTSPDSPNPQVPVIFLTGNAEETEIKEARDAGVTEYLIKPFSARQLADRIRQVVENPRSFIEAPTYKGPDRRRQKKGPPGGVERRKQDHLHYDIERPIL